MCELEITDSIQTYKVAQSMVRRGSGVKRAQHLVLWLFLGLRTQSLGLMTGCVCLCLSSKTCIACDNEWIPPYKSFMRKEMPQTHFLDLWLLISVTLSLLMESNLGIQMFFRDINTNVKRGILKNGQINNYWKKVLHSPISTVTLFETGGCQKA